MAPEQFRGRASTESDQYALGCLAYLLFTGQVPFAGSARATLLQKHQRDQPKPLTELNPAIPVPIETALFKALAKQPSARYGSVQAFLEALEDPHRAAIANQDTLVPLFDALSHEQEALTQFSPDLVFEVPTSATPEWEEEAPVSEPVTAATWSRTRVSSASPAVFAKPASSGQPAGRSSRVRGRSVLLPMILLVLAIVFATGGWLLFSSGHTQPQQSSARTAPTSVLTMSASAQATGTAISAQDPQLSASPTPTITPSPTATPSSTPTVGGLAAVTPFLDCVTPAGNNYVAQFGYLNRNTVAVTIPLGQNNAVSPSNLDGSQPTSFAPGSQHNVFRITFFKRQSVTWSLKGSTATASSNSPHC